MRVMLSGIWFCLFLFCVPAGVFADDLTAFTDADGDFIPDGESSTVVVGGGRLIPPARLLVDHAHSGGFLITGLTDFLISQGWTVDYLTDSVTYETLVEYDVFLIPSSMGPGQGIDFYSGAEATAVMAFVSDGNGLWCFSDYNKNPSGVNSVANQFGITFYADMIIDPVENVEGNSSWPLIQMIESHPTTEGVSSFGYFAGCCVGTESPAIVIATGGENAASSNCSEYPPVMSVYQNGGRAVFCGDITPLFPNYGITEEHWLLLANIADWLASDSVVATESMGWDKIKSMYR